MAKLHPFLKHILEECKRQSSTWGTEPLVLQSALAKAKAGGDFSDEEVAALKAALKDHMQ